MMINLLKFNRHWEQGFTYPFPKKRSVATGIDKKKDKRRITELTGLYLHLENLSNDLKISPKTLAKYLSILEQAFLIKILFNFTGNLITSQKKMKRAYLTTSSFAAALSDSVDTGSLAENFFVSQYPIDFFWCVVYKHEVDFILKENNHPVPVEIKYKSSLTKHDL